MSAGASTHLADPSTSRLHQRSQSQGQLSRRDPLTDSVDVVSANRSTEDVSSSKAQSLQRSVSAEDATPRRVPPAKALVRHHNRGGQDAVIMLKEEKACSFVLRVFRRAHSGRQALFMIFSSIYIHSESMSVCKATRTML